MRMITTALVALLLSGPALAQEAVSTNPYDDMVVSDDLSALPEAVRAMRQQLIDATKSGDIESLQAIIDAQDTPPTVSFGLPDDPVAYLKEQSADPEGRQILAVLRNVLEAPYAKIDASSETPSYVWPYLAVVPDISNLTPAQTVDAYRLVSDEDLKGMTEFGGWFAWRVFIGTDGEWQMFVSGD
ncbi:hypothetical protein [Devosia sp. 2618]|uniref:hypothetical protein n=1 Tax=Devosia sp. 2618 TaxID=3156454 RepID=UPI0033964A04